MTTADPLSDLLQVLRPRAYGFRGLDIGGDWALCLPPQPVVRCYALRLGACGLWIDGAPPVRLVEGDFMLVPHGQGLTMGSRLDAPQVDLNRFFTTASGDTAVFGDSRECSGLGGYFEMAGSATDSLLHALPPVVRLGAGADASGLVWLVDRLMAELRTPRPGGRLIAEHLSQTLLVEALRLHLASAEQRSGTWLAALADPQLARAIEAIHADPGARWTLEALAKRAGLSRSGFAQRFAETCGEPAIAYLARWRMVLATDRLARGVPIASVARDLGYGSESAFGAAFRRITGVSPGQLRKA
ncbi:AraC family transcriptional regulator [Sphingomonas sp. TREG-RG-20F-R18-01]|uniref:AraC family transcriptional regulator n=1 Tax=Sphingomonas sp. TREG-RG-20F-R18-01 TaxID=2914982 RepID=UPI001F5AFC1A|nr:AraC family transcriptional regulator [Sphingomonas sp. TREG-RG-20F-R18-01]